MGGRGAKSSFSGMTNDERKEEKKRLNENYEEWNDKAKKNPYGTMEFEGDGKAQVEFFKKYTNSYDLIDNLNDEETRAFLRWTEGRFMDSNVWKGFSNFDSRQKQLARIYDRIIDQATLNKGIIVNRLMTANLLLDKHKVSSLSELTKLEGRIIDVTSYMSCATASEGLQISDTTKNLQLRIHIPSGSKGAGMWVGNRKINAWGVRQREYMTNRDIAIRVGKSSYDEKTGVYTVNVYYEGRKSHDYND